MTETNEPFVFLNIYSAHFSQIHKKKERKKPGEVTTDSEPLHFLHSGVDFCRQRQETRKVLSLPNKIYNFTPRVQAFWLVLPPSGIGQHFVL